MGLEELVLAYLRNRDAGLVAGPGRAELSESRR